MKRVYFLLIAVIFTNYTFAQNTATLSILGEAEKKVTPDLAVIQIYISAKDKTESGSYNSLVTKSNDVLTKLKEFGFDEKQIKLSQFSITPEYKYDKGSQHLVGYNATQFFTAKFHMDKEKIFLIYEKLTNDNADGISVSFGTECSDELRNKTQNELIEAAIDDAKTKASLIARKAGYKLGEPLKIGYKYFDANDNILYSGNSTMARRNEDLNEKMAIGYDGTSASKLFSINDVEFNEEIRIIYGIAEK